VRIAPPPPSNEYGMGHHRSMGGMAGNSGGNGPRIQGGGPRNRMRYAPPPSPKSSPVPYS